MIVVTSRKIYKPGDKFIIAYGTHGIHLETPQPCIILREITFEEYMAQIRNKYVPEQIPTHMNKQDAIKHNRKFYEVSTD